MNNKKQKKENAELVDDELLDMVENMSNDNSECEEGAPEWMTTFSDLMTLLLCFFILLFSLSEIKLDKFMQASESLRAGFGQSDEEVDTQTGTGSIASSDTTGASLDNAVEDMLENIREQLEHFVAQYELTNTLDVSLDQKGVTLSIQDVVLFKPGSPWVTKDSEWVVIALGKIVNVIDIPLVVEGHTDNIPIKTSQYPSNWELSAVRAAGIARMLVEQGFDPASIYIEGYGEYRPIESNDTREGRSTNRRVDLLYTRDNVREKILEGEMIIDR